MNEVLVDDDRLLITRRLGSSGRSVVSFSGVGLRMGGLPEMQREEFGRSAGEAGDPTVVFVIDRTRSWYNEVFDQVVDVLRADLHGGGEIATLGNSMGGFAAFRMAQALPNCSRAIAFSPQYAVDPRHMPRQEKRWGEHRAAIAEHRIAHALEAETARFEASGTSYWAFFGINKLPDLAHMAAFRALGLPNVHALCLDECGHDVAAIMRRAGGLGPLLSDLLPPGKADRACVERRLAEHGLHVLGEEAFATKRAEQQQRWAQRKLLGPRRPNKRSPAQRPGF
jgi:pimeloyl-ACP methyl ester carboxylesterase